MLALGGWISRNLVQKTLGGISYINHWGIERDNHWEITYRGTSSLGGASDFCQQIPREAPPKIDF